MRAHQGAIRQFLYRLSGNDALADDLAQEVFLKAYQNLKALNKASVARSWLFQIAYRQYIDHYRRSKRRQDLHAYYNNPGRSSSAPVQSDSVYDTNLMGGPSAQSPNHFGLQIDIERAMAELPAPCRAVVMLCLAYGFSHKEAAKATNQPLGTVKSHIARGKTQLQAFLCAYDKAE